MAFPTQSEVRAILEEQGLPGRDGFDLTPSELRFPDGAHYRNEISSIEKPGVFRAMLDEAKRDLPRQRCPQRISDKILQNLTRPIEGIWSPTHSAARYVAQTLPEVRSVRSQEKERHAGSG